MSRGLGDVYKRQARAPKCMDCMFLALCPYGLSKRMDDLTEEAKEALEKGHMY